MRQSVLRLGLEAAGRIRQIGGYGKLENRQDSVNNYDKDLEVASEGGKVDIDNTFLNLKNRILYHYQLMI